MNVLPSHDVPGHTETGEFQTRPLLRLPVTRDTLICLKTGMEKVPGAPGITPATDRATKNRADEEHALLCFHCLHPITSRREKTSVCGGHTHVFANPGGLVFEIGCFRTAPGCGHDGPPTLEFTWFEGYAWQIATCNGCLSHLGWYYTSAGSSFYGLILSRLVDPG